MVRTSQLKMIKTHGKPSWVLRIGVDADSHDTMISIGGGVNYLHVTLECRSSGWFNNQLYSINFESDTPTS